MFTFRSLLWTESVVAMAYRISCTHYKCSSLYQFKPSFVKHKITSLAVCPRVFFSLQLYRIGIDAVKFEK